MLAQFFISKNGNGYFRAVKLLLWKILFIGLFTLLLIIPYAIFMLCFFSVRNNLFPTIDPLMTEIIGWVFLAIFIIAYFALIFFVERYALANYVAIEKSALKAKNCIDISVNMMKGRKISLILLSLSIYWPLFIPVPIFIAFAFLTYLSQLFMIGFLITYLLWFLCMFASMFYLLPWYEMAMAKFAIVTFSQENTPAENE